jgi:hypothetical protein
VRRIQFDLLLGGRCEFLDGTSKDFHPLCAEPRSFGCVLLRLARVIDHVLYDTEDRC